MAGLAAEQGFTTACTKLLGSLANAGIVVGSAAKDLADPGWGVQTSLVLWGAVVHRQRTVALIAGPPALAVEGPRQPKSIQKFQRFTSAHVESRNTIASPEIGVPGAVTGEFFARLDLRWDLTAWVERQMNRELFLSNEGRVHTCAACLRQHGAFCDWRPPLGTAWLPEYDICVEDTPEELHACTGPNGVVDADGHPVLARFFSMGGSEGLASCEDMQFQRANRELHLSSALSRFVHQK